MAAASFPSIPSTFKPPQRTLPPRRRPNPPLSPATPSHRSYFAATVNHSYFAAAAAAANDSYFTAATDQFYFATAAAADQSYFTAATAAIASHLLRSLAPTIHPSVKTPILRLLSSPSPPSIAPPLCLAASQLIPRNPNPNSALNAACALHLIHTVTHARASAALTGADLMGGDALLAFAYEMVARTPAGDSEGAVRVLKVLMEVAETAAAVAAAEEKGEREGRLAAAAAACGVRVAGGGDEEVERARRVGMLAGKMEWGMAEKELGLGFQEEGRAGPVRRLLHEMILKQDLEK